MRYQAHVGGCRGIAVGVTKVKGRWGGAGVWEEVLYDLGVDQREGRGE